MNKIVMKKLAAVGIAGAMVCGVIVMALGGSPKVKPLLIEADTGQNGVWAKILMFGDKGSIALSPMPNNPHVVPLENVKLTEKVEILTAPVWTLKTDSGLTLTFAPSAKGWICESCGLQNLPVMWHVATPKE